MVRLFFRDIRSHDFFSCPSSNCRDIWCRNHACQVMGHNTFTGELLGTVFGNNAESFKPSTMAVLLTICLRQSQQWVVFLVR